MKMLSNQMEEYTGLVAVKRAFAEVFPYDYIKLGFADEVLACLAEMPHPHEWYSVDWLTELFYIRKKRGRDCNWLTLQQTKRGLRRALRGLVEEGVLRAQYRPCMSRPYGSCRTRIVDAVALTVGGASVGLLRESHLCNAARER